MEGSSKTITSGTMTENDFLSIFADAVTLLELSSEITENNQKSALAKSSILLTNFAFESAANCFTESITIDPELRKKIDRFSSLEKLNLVLQWHGKNPIPKCDELMDMVKLVRARNAMAHPKINKQDLNYITEIDDSAFPIKHFQSDQKGRRKVTKEQISPRHFLESAPAFYSEQNAKLALTIFTKFMNTFVTDWWEIDFRESERYLFTTLNTLEKGNRIMFKANDVKTLLRNNHFLEIKFIGLYNLLPD